MEVDRGFGFEDPQDALNRQSQLFRDAANNEIQGMQDRFQQAEAQRFREAAQQHVENMNQSQLFRDAAQTHLDSVNQGQSDQFRNGANDILDKFQQAEAQRQQEHLAASFDQPAPTPLTGPSGEPQLVTWPDGTKHWSWETPPPPPPVTSTPDVSLMPQFQQAEQQAARERITPHQTYIGPASALETYVSPEQQQANAAETLPVPPTPVTGILTPGEAEQISPQTNAPNLSPLDVPIVRRGVEQLPEPLRTGVETTLSQFTPATALASLGLPGGAGILPKLALQAGAGATAGQALEQYAGAPSYTSTIGAFAGPLAAPGLEAAAGRIGHGFGQSIQASGGLVPYLQGEQGGTRIERQTYSVVRRGGSGATDEYEANLPLVNDRYLIHKNTAPQSATDAYGQKAVWLVKDTSNDSLVRGGFNTRKDAIDFAGGLPTEKAPVAAQPPMQPPTGGEPPLPVEPTAETGQSPQGVDLLRAVETAHLTSPESRNILNRALMASTDIPVVGDAIRQVAKVGLSPASVAEEPALVHSVGYQLMKEVQDSQLERRVAEIGAEVGKVNKNGTVTLASGQTAAPEEIVNNPGSYQLTQPEQNFYLVQGPRFMDEKAQQVLQATGQNIQTQDAYGWARFVKKDNGVPQIRGSVGARQTPFQQRVYENINESLAAGNSYESPKDALVLYGRALDKAIRDDAYKQAMIGDGLLHTGTPKLGEASAQPLGPGFNGYSFNDPKDLQTAMSVMRPQYQGWMRPLEAVSGFQKISKTALVPFTHFLIQGGVPLATEPGAWRKGVGASIQEFIKPGSYEKWLAENPTAQLMADAGTIGPSEIREAGQATGPIQGALKRVTNTYNTFINVGSAYAGKALLDAGKVAPYSDEFYRVGRFAKTLFSSADAGALGVSGGQRQAERTFGLFAARYYRSGLGLIGHMADQGIVGATAKRALASYAAGGTAAFTGFGLALGLSPHEILDRLNPRTPKTFMTLPIAGKDVGFGGFYRGLLELASAPDKNWDFSTPTSPLLHNPLVTYLRNRTSPVTGDILNAIDKSTPANQQIDVNKLFTNPKTWPGFLANLYSPIPVETIRGGTGGLGGALELGAASLAGGHARTPTPYDNFIRTFKQETGRDFNPEVDYRVAQANPKLSGMLDQMHQQGVETGTPGAVSSQQTQDAQTQIEQELNLPKIAQGVLSGDQKAGPAFVTAFGDFQTEMAGALIRAGIGKQAADPQTPEGQAYVAWKAVRPQMNPDYTMNWDDYFAQKDAAFAKLPQDLQTAISGQLRSLDPTTQQVEKQYEAARSVRQQLFQIPKYQGMTADQSHAQDTFDSSVAQKAQQVSLKLGYNVSDAVVADALAQQQGDPKLAEWYRALHSSRGPQLLNPDYTKYLQTNQSTLETFFPNYYTTRFYEATGQISPTNPYQRPAAPNPHPPSIRQQMEQYQQGQDVQGILAGSR